MCLVDFCRGDGTDWFWATTDALVEATGWDRSTIIKHLKRADTVWFERRMKGRKYHYKLKIPVERSARPTIRTESPRLRSLSHAKGSVSTPERVGQVHPKQGNNETKDEREIERTLGATPPPLRDLLDPAARQEYERHLRGPASRTVTK